MVALSVIAKTKKHHKYPSAVEQVKIMLYNGMLYTNENKETVTTHSSMDKSYKSKC